MTVRALISKELFDLWREKTLLVAIVVQLFVAGFSAFLLVGLQAVTDPDSTASFPELRVAYDGPPGLDQHLIDAGVGVLRRDGEASLEAWHRGSVDVVVEDRIGADGRHTVTLLFAQGDPVATLHVTHLKGILLDYEADLREQYVERLAYQAPQWEPRAAPPAGFAYATLLPLLVLVPVFLSGAIAGDALSQELQDRTMLLLRTTPAAPATLLIGKIAVPVLLAPIQVMLWLWLYGANGFPVQNILWLLGLAATLALLLASLGMVVALWVRQEGKTQAAYAVLAIAVASAAMALPRDPLNVIALLATGTIEPVLSTLAVYVAAAVLAAGAAAWSFGRKIGHDAV